MRYEAEFSPQAWVNDYAMSVDPQGPTAWDATEFVQQAAPEWVRRTLERGNDHDDILRTDPNAPEWVREWSGPFETYLRYKKSMEIKVTVISTGHHEDRGRDSMVLVFANDESEDEMVRAMAETYYLDEDDEGKKVELPNELTWEWLVGELESIAWWNLDEREIEIDTRRPNARVRG